MSRMKRLAIAAACIAVALQLAACSSAPPATETTPAAKPAKSKDATAGKLPAGRTIVTMKDNKYDFTDLTVKVGTTVTWSNQDKVEHTVTFDSGLDSGPIPGGQQASHKFTTAGTFTYHCSIHPSMKAKVTVTP